MWGRSSTFQDEEIRPGEIEMVEIGPVPLLLGAQEGPGRIVVGRLGQDADRAGASRRRHVRAAQAQIGDEIMVEALEGERAVISRGEGGDAVGDPPVAVEPALELADDRGPAGDGREKRGEGRRRLACDPLIRTLAISAALHGR